MTPITASASFIADAQGVDRVHRVMQQFLDQVGEHLKADLDDSWRREFTTAIGELISNIARHAYRDTDVPDAWITLELSATPVHVEAVLRDGGEPFAGDLTTPAPSGDEDPLSLLEESGRGIEIIRRTVDAIDYERMPSGHNRWTIEKLLQGR